MGLRFTFQREGGEPLIYNVATVSQYTIDKLDKGGAFYEETFVIDSESPKIPSTAYNHFIIDKGYPWSEGSSAYQKTEWALLTRSGCLALNNIVTIENGIDYDTTYPIAPKKFLMTKQTEKFICSNGNYVVAKQDNSGWVNYEVYDKNNSLLKTFNQFDFGGGPGYAGYVIWATTSYTDFLNPNANMYYISTQASKRGYIYIKTQRSTNRMDPFRYAIITKPIDPDKPNDPFKPDTTPNTPDGTGGNDNNRPDGEYDQNGEFNDTDDKIDNTQLPPDTASAVGTGFISLYTPTFSQLTSLATFLWSPGFADTISKLFANPFEVIMNLHSMPFTVPAGATQNIRCGNVDTKVVAPLVASQYFTFDFGTVKIPKYSGTYLDYSPYTSYKITLPYMTTYSLNTDEITGKTLGLKYHVDVATGDTVAVISVDGQDTYTFTGNIATNIPITQGDYTNFWTTLTKATFDTAQTAVAAGAGGASQATGGVGALSSAVETVMQQKPEIRTSGVLGSNFGNFGHLRPYITKIKPNLLIPKDQQTYTGFASYFVTSIGECKGYNQFTDIILKGFDYATDEEKAMIKSELEKGVIL